MLESTLDGKRVLAVDDEIDILELLEEELEEFGVKVDTASSYAEADRKMSSQKYDVAVLDIMGVRGFELLEVAVEKDLPVVMLTAHALNPETLKKSIELGARAYLPKDHLGQIAPFLADVLTASYPSVWQSVLGKIGVSFGHRFGPEWRKSEEQFWKEFEKDLELPGSTIIDR